MSDAVKVTRAVELLAAGNSDLGICRILEQEFSCTDVTALAYLQLGYEELSPKNMDIAKHRDKILAMIFHDRLKAIDREDWKEAGKAIERYMRLIGVDKKIVDMNIRAPLDAKDLDEKIAAMVEKIGKL
jgi:hypothetical protein